MKKKLSSIIVQLKTLYPGIKIIINNFNIGIVKKNNDDEQFAVVYQCSEFFTFIYLDGTSEKISYVEADRGRICKLDSFPKEKGEEYIIDLKEGKLKITKTDDDIIICS